MVSVARRNLFQDKARLLISTGGVAFALLLILALDGVVEGSLSQITAYITNTGADVYVAQAGVRTMHMSASALPLTTADEVSAVEGVRSVAPILYTTNPVESEGGRSLAYIIGFRPDRGVGGPWKVVEGSADLSLGEVVLDEIAARKLGVGVGDRVSLLGNPFVIRGLSSGTFTITNSVAFIRFDDFARLRDLPRTAGYLLVFLEPGVGPADGARAIKDQVPGVEAMTWARFESEEGRVVRDMMAQIMVVMNSAGFVIGLVAVALTIYTATLAKTREYGVLKALGARSTWLYRLVFEQALVSVALGAVAAVVLAYALSAIFSLALPEVPLRITANSVAKVALGGGVIAVLSAALPVRRVAALDPASVFRR
ncbi:MAG: ABC transporter permease [Thermoleophilia bacterium]